jgi:hypothetical protein
VADLVVLSGRGEYVVVSAISALVDRGLLSLGEASDDVGHRQELLGALEGIPAPAAAAPVATSAAPAPAPRAPAAPPAPATRAPVIPERPEPFTPPRQPEHAEPAAPTYARASTPAQRPGATVAAVVGEVHGATAMQPNPEATPSSYIERDPSVNKSLLLRLIAGVRGL